MRELAVAAVLALGLSAAAVIATKAHAKGIAVNTVQPGVVILLTDEPCEMKDKVANLPNRATWSEKGVTIEGCFGVYGSTVMAYFSDLTVVAIPAHTFREAIST